MPPTASVTPGDFKGVLHLHPGRLTLAPDPTMWIAPANYVTKATKKRSPQWKSLRAPTMWSQPCQLCDRGASYTCAWVSYTCTRSNYVDQPCQLCDEGTNQLCGLNVSDGDSLTCNLNLQYASVSVEATPGMTNQLGDVGWSDQPPLEDWLVGGQSS